MNSKTPQSGGFHKPIRQILLLFLPLRPPLYIELFSKADIWQTPLQKCVDLKYCSPLENSS